MTCLTKNFFAGFSLTLTDIVLASADFGLISGNVSGNFRFNSMIWSQKLKKIKRE